MSPERVEDLVAEYLDARAGQPELAPESFAAAHGADAAEIARAIRRTLGIERLLTDGRGPTRERVGPYRVVRELGRGGMGLVFEVERDRQRFALKLLHAGSGARTAERFAREARALERLAHPNVVAVRDVGVEAGEPYLVMELVAGEPLSTLAAALDPRRTAEIVRDLARAVHAAHECGVLHRDIKPQNVIVRTDGTPVLVDFGLVAIEDEASLTSTGALLGTPRYMAPEQARGAPADRRSDVYGLGLVLYELASRHPARGESAREVLLQQIARDDVAWPRGTERELARIAMAALARNPRRRTSSAAELAGELQRWLDGRPTHARPPSAWSRALDRARERPAWHWAAAVGTLGLVAALAFAELRGEPSARQARETFDRRLELAREQLLAGEIDRGLRTALAAAPPFARSGGEAAAELPHLLSAVGDQAALRAALERVAAASVEDPLPAYLLAWACDSAHELEAAERAYLRALELDPAFLRARLNLAHLRAGAQLGACGACDAAYAAAPRMLAPAAALADLTAAIARDRGASSFATGRAVQTTLDLARRAPEIGAPAAVRAQIERTLAAPDLDATARDRLEEARRRLSSARGG